MNMDKGLSFVGGFLFGAIVGAAVALLMAPYSGEETRDHIRAESADLKRRGEEFGDDTVEHAQKLVKQGQKGVSDASTRVGDSINTGKDNVLAAVGVGK